MYSETEEAMTEEAGAGGRADERGVDEAKATGDDEGREGGE